jgi:FkbM family methyltransferase
VIGYTTLLWGSFERAEIEMLRAAVRPGTIAIDVGANVGIFTIPLALVAGEVWAIEPLRENAARVRENARRNGLANVAVFTAAAADEDGEVRFHLARDSVYGSTREVFDGHDTGETRVVPALRLDGEWLRRDRPSVSVLKVDVEGAELAVLRGARNLLENARPALLVEAGSAASLLEIDRFLLELGYERQPHAAFAPQNHFFVPAAKP